MNITTSYAFDKKNDAPFGEAGQTDAELTGRQQPY